MRPGRLTTGQRIVAVASNSSGSSTVDTGTRATNSSARSRLTTSLACRKQRHAHLRRTVRTPPACVPSAVPRTRCIRNHRWAARGRKLLPNCRRRSRRRRRRRGGYALPLARTLQRETLGPVPFRPPTRPLRSTPVHGPSGSDRAVRRRSRTTGGVRFLSARALRRSQGRYASSTPRRATAGARGPSTTCLSVCCMPRARAFAASAQGASFRMSPRALSATHRRFASHRRVQTGSSLRCA